MRVLSLVAGAAAAAFASAGTGNVNVELYAESLCPDCRDFAPTFQAIFNMSCVQQMTAEYTEIEYGNAKENNGVITCQHGPNECAGNMIEACALAHTPKGSRAWIDFNTCMYANVQRIPAVAEQCATAVGLDWAPIDKCYGNGKGREGVALIQANANRTAALNPPHTYVPWLVVAGVPIPDPPSGGPSQADVLAAICTAYTGTQPACCSAEALAALPKPARRDGGLRRAWGSRADW